MAYTDNIIAELDFEDGMAGVTSHGSPTYSVQSVGGQDRKTINVLNGQLTLDTLVADYAANRESTDKMTISFWFKHNGGDAWIVSDMFGIGGGVQSRFRLTLDGRFSSSVRINVGLGAMNHWYPANGGLNSNGVGMQGNPLSHGQWHHVSMVYDETLVQPSGDTGDVTLYFDGVKIAGGFQRNWGGLGANGLDDLINAPHFCIGGRGVNDQTFNGELSHFVVHGRALSEQEITELMNALPGAGGGQGEFDSTHGGALSGIKSFMKCKDSNDAEVYMYAKDAGGTTSLYLASDLSNFGTFIEYNSVATGIEGAPLRCSQASDGTPFIVTSANKIYLIECDSTAFTSATELAAVGEDIDSMRGGSDFIFILCKSGSLKTYTPGAGLISRLDVSTEYDANTVICDAASNGAGHLITVRRGDMSYEACYASGDWNTLTKAAGLNFGIQNVKEVNFFADENKWYASNGSAVVSTNDINDWII